MPKYKRQAVEATQSEQSRDSKTQSASSLDQAVAAARRAAKLHKTKPFKGFNDSYGLKPSTAVDRNQ